MGNNHEKMMTDLQRLMATQDFKSVEELNEFMQTMIGSKIPSFPKEALNFKEQAQDLVFAAYELPPHIGRQNIVQAIQLFPELIEAYEYLAYIEEYPEIALIFFEKAISIGRKQFDSKYLKKNKGMFWGIHETRPFMRSLQQCAECLYAIGKSEESIAMYEEIIELNPNDNQGVRDLLMLYLIELGEKKKFLNYSKMFKDDVGAYALFNRALFNFKFEGESEESDKQLKEALIQNNFVAKKLLAKKEITSLSSEHSFGDENEANYYAAYAQLVWRHIPGALEWLKKHSSKSKS